MGLNDYKVRVKGKERVYHANLLKKYFEQEDSVSVGAVAVETNTNICKSGHVKSEVEEVDPVDSIDFLKIGGYVAKESVNDVAIGDNLSHEQRAEFMDLANEFHRSPRHNKFGSASYQTYIRTTGQIKTISSTV